MDGKFEMVAKTFGGLEDVLVKELVALGAENVEAGVRMVSFEGDLKIMYKANLCTRTALRILKPIYKFTATDPDELYDTVREIDWEKYLGVDSTFAIDSTVNSNEFRHSKYVTYRVKDGIVDHFNDKYGHRPSIRITGADLILNVHIHETQVTISLDSTGLPLSYRGYREEQTKAPINEALAAGILLKAGYNGDTPLIDPMCGSGTFLIEAALIAANINPGIYRKGFAFEKWPDFDAELLEELYNDDSGERSPKNPIMGGDIDPEAVVIARKNIASARVGEYVKITCKSVTEWKPETFEGEELPEGMLVMNPPYGERLKLDKMEELYAGIGKVLKENFKGWHAWILGYKNELFDFIRLKPSVKYDILNGSLECSLREYVMFDGRYNDFRAEGGSVGREKYQREREERSERKPLKRFSKEAWDEETKKFGFRKPRNSGRRFDSKFGKDGRKEEARGERKEGGYRNYNRNERFSGNGASADPLNERKKKGWK